MTTSLLNTSIIIITTTTTSTTNRPSNTPGIASPSREYPGHAVVPMVTIVVAGGMVPFWHVGSLVLRRLSRQRQTATAPLLRTSLHHSQQLWQL